MGKPTGHNGPVLPDEHIVWVEGTRGTETSKYPEEKKKSFDSLSSGERNGKSLNQNAKAFWGYGPDTWSYKTLF
jgi:hypothetical protein